MLNYKFFELQKSMLYFLYHNINDKTKIVMYKTLTQYILHNYRTTDISKKIERKMI